MRIRHVWKVVAAAGALILGSAAVPGVAVAVQPSPTAVPPVSALPEPFSGWAVDLDPVADDPRILRLAFDSPLLGQRITNTVYLPSSHREDGRPSPVVYSLHGTVMSALDNCALNPVTRLEAFVRMVSCGGGNVQDRLYDIQAQLDRMQFLVVSPDTDPADTVCESCAWIDGRSDLLPGVHPVTAETLPADSFLHEELYPLVEALFNVRTDRGGRGVIGFSMGGWAAALQGMLHPDRYAYIGWHSGFYEIFEPELNAVLNANGYLRDQGYGTSVTDEIWWRQYNPADLAPNIRGTGAQLLLSTGDACLSPSSLSSPDCRGRFSPVANPTGVVVEEMIHRNWEIATSDLKNKDIPFESVELPGVHGSSNHLVFSEHIVPSANETFAGEVATPDRFSYRSVLPEFSVWGYDVAVTRSNDEFLAMSDARTDGRSLTLTGSGTVELVTPAAFAPGETYTVAVSAEDAGSSEEVTADEGGRLHLRIDLGRGRLLDETSLVNGLGQAPTHSTLIRVEG